MMQDNKKMIAAVVAYVVIFLIMITYSIYISGGTFGYRCGKIYKSGTAQFDRCVNSLAYGKDLYKQ